MSMRKHCLCALLLAQSAGAQAHLTTWEFSYQGFVDISTGVFDPNRQFSGLFTGEDGNGNGIIAREELVYLSAGGRTYIDPTGIGCNYYDGAAGFRCSVEEFSYALTGHLVFSGRQSVGAESAYWNMRVVTGEIYEEYNDVFGQTWHQLYAWTEQTTFTISPQPLPVPEPSIALLLPSGGAALWGLGRWRQRSRSTH